MEKENNGLKLYKDLPLVKGSFELFDARGTYVNCLRMFFGYYSAVPNYLGIDNIDVEAFKKWFEEQYAQEIIKQHSRKDYESEKKELEVVDQFYFLKGEIMLNVELGCIYMLFTDETQRVLDLFEEFKRFVKIPKRSSDINLIVPRDGDLVTRQVQIKKPKINFSFHYNEDFLAIHRQIVKQLNKQDSTGLYLFHGEPGTGKSTYIKYLIHQVKKKVIFISPKMAGQLDSISVTPFLLENRNSVLVIEDSEELIASREEIRNSNLSMLLNLTDGLLGESLGIQIIATFNTDVKNIDKALLRKGRLSVIYEFKALDVERTNLLLNKLGYSEKAPKGLTVAEIFNFERDNNHKPQLRKAVGFGF